VLRESGGGGPPLGTVTYDRRTLLPVSRESFDPRYVVTYGEYRPFGELWWPTEILVSAVGRELAIEIEDLEVNPDLPDDLFEIDLPDGVDVESR
jgi:hypothetical protein